MQDFPHQYAVTAAGHPEGDIAVTSPGLDSLVTAAPAEFDGPGDRWSPETMLVGAVANCFILTFRAIARASKLHWDSLVSDAEGTLERIDRVTQFTSFTLHATLSVPPGTDVAQARRILERAEQGCLVSSSLKAGVHLEAMVVTSERAPQD